MKQTIQFRIPVQVGTEEIKDMLTEIGVDLIPGSEISQTSHSVTLHTVQSYTPEQRAATAAHIWQRVHEKAVIIEQEEPQ